MAVPKPVPPPEPEMLTSIVPSPLSITVLPEPIKFTVRPVPIAVPPD